MNFRNPYTLVVSCKVVLPNRQNGEEQDREDHLEKWQRSKAEPTQHSKLQQLKAGVQVNLLLRDVADVVVWRICRL